LFILFKSDTVRWALVINNIINQSVPCAMLTLGRLSYVSVAPISTVDQQSWPDWGELDTPLCDKVCQWLATGRWLFHRVHRFPLPI